MKKNQKFLEAYDAVRLTPDEKEQLALLIENDVKKRQAKIVRWPVKAAVAAASLIVVFSAANIGTYAYAEESLIQFITQASSGIINSKLFGADSDTAYIAERTHEVQQTITTSEYEFSVVDYLYDPSMEALYFSVRISSPDGTPVTLAERTSEFDTTTPQVASGEFIYVGNVLGTFLGTQSTVRYIMVNENTQTIMQKYEEHEDGLYIYVYCNNVTDGSLSIYETTQLGEYVSGAEVIYTFALEEDCYAETYVTEYNGTTISMSPFQIDMKSNDGVAIQNMTIHYTDGSEFAALKDGTMAMTNGSSSYGIDAGSFPLGRTIMMDNVRRLSDIDYIEIDGVQISLQ